MIYSFRILAVAVAYLPPLALTEPIRTRSIIFRQPLEVEHGGIHNIHVDYQGDIDGELTIAYGACDTTTPSQVHHHVGSTHVGAHHLAARHLEWEDQRPGRFVWVTPSNIPTGCLHAFLDGNHVGRSDELMLKHRRVRRQATMESVADPMGPWFDGVAYLQQKQPNETFVAATKSKRFGILGAGMAGLTTGLMLDSVGVRNWKILESSNRLGGRMWTSYLNNTRPEEGQYHEMGPMRFPYEITDPDTNETFPINDQKMVFQLADVLNEINAGNEELQVRFIPWIQSADNTPLTTNKRRPDGTFPGKTEIAKDPAYAADPVAYSNETAAEEALQALDDFKALSPERIKFYATDVFRAHKEAVEQGLFDWSEVEYLRKVIGTPLNTTDEVTPSQVVWPMWEYETVYFLANKWRTIAGGLSRMSEAFAPIVQDRIQFNSRAFSIKHNGGNNTVSVGWRESGRNPREVPSQTEEFDYVFNSVPFNLLKFWELPAYSSLMRRAIDRTVFGGAVKVAIQYETRFWEHLEKPIYGGCGRVNSPLIGQICYPSWGINETGPGTMMASYIPDYDATVACSMPEEEHIAYVQRAMVAIHGQIAEDQWTGNYARHCWEHDPNHAGAFALPIVPQQQLYLPAFFRTEFNTVFIGEHTSYTHSWVFSALESAARGTVQMLLDLGLVDEAKQINQDWMARWIQL
ncbi:L-amino-acid oxidase-2 [Elsinoe australis]|uniref:L-amino-acid oxidase-2 n=1 Tax=Elsinoe australis TaxID=40998 RepID=A0A4U7AU11_9PEZI|nr:L-amino-acid oxidase-2 [Elsinoe australis]